MATVKIVDLELFTVTTATLGTSKTEKLGSREEVAKELAKLLDDGYGKLVANETVITLVKNDTPATRRRVAMYKGEQSEERIPHASGRYEVRSK